MSNVPLALILCLGIFVQAAAGFGGGLLMPNSQAGALNVHPRSAGTASGLSGFLQMGMAAIFTQLVGMFQGETPYPMVVLMVVAAALGLLSMTLALRVGARSR